ncbi:hypothetical protein QYF36_020545 [Acer negundo]|nr:hypothetical protein QYF36_020545 [Acer negundo]
MDSEFAEFSNSMNLFNVDHDTVFPNSNEYLNVSNGFEFDDPSLDTSFVDGLIVTPERDSGFSDQSFSLSQEGESSSPSDDNDFSETVLKYISQMLMEEDMEEKPCMFHDPLALQAKEQSLYEVLGEKYSSSPDQPLFYNAESPDDCFSSGFSDHGSNSSSSSCTNHLFEPFCSGDHGESRPSLLQTPIPSNFVFQSTSTSSSQTSGKYQNGFANNGNVSVASATSELLVSNSISQSELMSQFRRGEDEASKFLPKLNQIVIDLETDKFAPELKEKATKVVVKAENVEREHSPSGLREKRNHEQEDSYLEEERSNKQSAVYVEDCEQLLDIFDKLFICHERKGSPARNPDYKALPNDGPRKALQQNGQTKGFSAEKNRSKKPENKKEVDLRTLLIQCAQAVSADDRRTANEMLKQIRQHSSPFGDGTQRFDFFPLKFMDPNNSTGFSDFDDETLLAYSNQFSNYIENGSKFTIPSPDLYLLDAPYNPPDPDPGVITTPSSTLSQDFDSFVGSSSVSPDGSLFAPSMGWSPEGGEASSSPSDDGESSDPVLKYISQMLLEEDMDDKPSMFYDPLTLQATEKSLFDVLGEQHRNYSSPNSQLQFYPSPVNGVPESYLNFSSGSIDFNGSSGAFTGTYGGTGSDFVGAHGDAGELNPLLLQSPLPGNHHFQSNSQQPTSRLSGNLSESVTNIGDGSMSSSVNELLAQNIFSDSESILQFNRGMEEASKFLPTSNQLVVDVESYNFSKERKEETSMVAVKVEKDERENSSDWLRGRKNHEREEDLDLEEERSNKQSAVTVEESELSDMFDKVLLICTDSKGQPAMCPAEVPVVAVQTGESNSLQPNGKSNGGKSRGKKQGKKKMETVDLRTLLILCAQAVSTNDCRTANELLKQIRQHSSSTGDGSQRLAHFFANGLEARMAGSGMGILIQLLSMLPDGPPKLRITGIEIDYQILPGPDRQAWIKFEYVEDYLQRPLPYQHSVQISIHCDLFFIDPPSIAMMSGLSENGVHGKKALVLFEEMLAEGTKPDYDTMLGS